MAEPDCIHDLPLLLGYDTTATDFEPKKEAKRAKMGVVGEPSAAPHLFDSSGCGGGANGAFGGIFSEGRKGKEKIGQKAHTHTHTKNKKKKKKEREMTSERKGLHHEVHKTKGNNNNKKASGGARHETRFGIYIYIHRLILIVTRWR